MRHIYAVILPLVFISTLSSAESVYVLRAPESSIRFGAVVADAGDVDGDGISDIIAAATTPAAMRAAYAHVLSGASLRVLRTLASPLGGRRGTVASSVAGGCDLDGDGRADLAVGMRGDSPEGGPDAAGCVSIFSGKSGLLLRSLASPNPMKDGWFGAAVAFAGDVNGDGCPDFLVGADGEGPGSSPEGSGRAYVFCGATGEMLREFRSPAEELAGGFGCAVALIADRDRDGVDDVAVSSCEGVPAGVPAAGTVHIFSAVSGRHLATLTSPSARACGFFGSSICRIDDIDGDGIDEIAVGAPGEDGDPGVRRAGRVHVYSGATGRVIMSLQSSNRTPFGRFGGSVSPCHDIDGDGHGDLLVGGWAETVGEERCCGAAYLFSGRTGTIIAEVHSPAPSCHGGFGYSVATLPALTDAGPRFLVGADGEGTHGVAYVVDGTRFSGSSNSGSVLPFGDAAPDPVVDPFEMAEAAEEAERAWIQAFEFPFDDDSWVDP